MTARLAELIELAQSYTQCLPPAPALHPLTLPLASYLDCALHNPEATPDMIEQLCAQAQHYLYATVFINPIFVQLAKQSLRGSGVRVGTVSGFPLGGFPTQIKVEEARVYLDAGADEIDMVIAVGMLKAGEYGYVLDDIQQVVEMVHSKGGLVKVILEMALLDRFEKIIGCLLSKAAGADFVKTSTGFSKGGATVEDVQLLRRVVGPATTMGVKAAGGIRCLKDVRAMLDAGANRIGTRLAAQILEEDRAHAS